MKRLVVALVAGLATLHGSLAQADEVYGQVGTEGLVIGYAYALGSRDNVRAEFNGFSLSHNFSSGDLNYDGKLNLAPWRSVCRLLPGAHAPAVPHLGRRAGWRR